MEFERGNNVVTEGDGDVDTCLVLNCEAAQPITVTVTAQESTVPEARSRLKHQNPEGWVGYL